VDSETLTAPAKAPAKSSSVIPAKIDRFTIERSLGAGSQGTVLLAIDERLSRHVALKLLRPTGVDIDKDQLDSEARISSQLQHPNLVTLHEVGTFHHLRYLVFEFVNGESLKDRLQREGTLSLKDAVILTSQILAGVAYLHSQGIVHRDLSPANILLTSDGIPKVTDFGISTWYQDQAASGEISGTLPYMSPEPFAGQPLGPHSDVFTMGAIFYELITGTRLMHWSSREAIIHDIVNGEPDTATALLDCDPIVKRVINKALQRPVALRYPSAQEMKADLDTYRVSRGASDPGKSTRHSTVEFLIRRMQHKKGFSALSGHISKVLQMTSAESGVSAERIANILAKDPTLSQRVLTAANSAFYGNTDITTLPRAIVLLGFEQVRMSVTKALLERQFANGSPLLHDALIRSFFSSILAKVLAHRTGFRRTADAFTCAMFHDLGRTLTIHYFADEHQAILDFAAERLTDELTASREILGIPYYELGADVARIWKFPESIIQTMLPLPRGEIAASADDNAHLVFIAAFANSMCSAALTEQLNAANEQIIKLVARSQAAWELSFEHLDSAFAEANELTLNYARLLKVEPDDQPSLKQLVRPFIFSANEETETPAQATASQ
jgi:serine/threonine protein kinase